MRDDYKTKQREAILRVLKESSTHQSAGDIILRLKESGIKIGTATVYRTLEKLLADGYIKRLVPEDASSACYQYLGSRECSEHFHLKCTKCGALSHLSCEFMHELEAHIFSEHGFSISSGRTVIYGLCAKCRESKADGPHMQDNN